MNGFVISLMLYVLKIDLGERERANTWFSILFSWLLFAGVLFGK